MATLMPTEPATQLPQQPPQITRAEPAKEEAQFAALIAKIHASRAAIDREATSMQTAATELRGLTRVASTGDAADLVSSHTAFASSYMRMGAAITQAIRRTKTVDRLIQRAQEERVEDRRREELALERKERAERRARDRVIAQAATPSSDTAFEEVYGDVNGH